MKKCYYCGAPLKDDATECEYCRKEQNVSKTEGASKSEVKDKILQKPQANVGRTVVDMVGKAVVKIMTSFSKGSGFIIEGNRVVTNAHVISMEGKDNATLIARSICCQFDGEDKIYQLKVVTLEPHEDVAILEVLNADRKFNYLKLGNSDNVKMGDTVFTIGCPLNYDFSYTEGVISSPRRKVEHKFYPTIQTNLSINHGNSGGPLCNCNGEVIGMVTFNQKHLSHDLDIVADDGVRNIGLLKPIDGMGFCISVDAIKGILSTI